MKIYIKKGVDYFYLFERVYNSKIKKYGKITSIKYYNLVSDYFITVVYDDKTKTKSMINTMDIIKLKYL